MYVVFRKLVCFEQTALGLQHLYCHQWNYSDKALFQLVKAEKLKNFNLIAYKKFQLELLNIQN